MTEDIYLSVIIPAYNEEARIEKTLRRVHAYLSRQSFSYEILVVVDQATDNTAGIVRAFMKETPHLCILERTDNHGKGYSVKGGMLAAEGEIRLFTDADNSTDISYFDAMKPLFDEGYDVVISSRHPWDAAGAAQEVSQVWYKRMLGIAGNLFIQFVAVWGIWDTQNGFKAFRKEAAQKLFSQVRIYRWGFDVEVLALARRAGLRIGIIPIQWKNDERSHVKLSGYLTTLWDTVRVRWNLMRGIYKA